MYSIYCTIRLLVLRLRYQNPLAMTVRAPSRLAELRSGALLAPSRLEMLSIGALLAPGRLAVLF